MGLFSKIFATDKLSQPVYLATIGVDMHSHLIPGIDDGCKTIEQSVELIRQMSELGYSKLITTPHVQGEVYVNTPEIILAGLDNLRLEVEKAGIKIKLDAAAEYLLDDRFEEKLKTGTLLTFGKKFILVELSYFSPHPRMKEFIFNLQLEGYQVILAHPERYSYWFTKFNKFEELKDRGIFFQLNTNSLSGYYDQAVKKTAEKFIDAQMYDFIGTDLHNESYMQGLRKAQYEKSLDKVLSSGKIKNQSLM